MKYKEYGSANARTILLLHGGGLSWWNYREEAELLKKEYHIIVPVLDGHAGSDKHFSTIESNARDIISFINEYLNGSVFMLCGLSLGGQILLEMLSQQADICRYAVIESVALIPSGIINGLISPAIYLSYPLIKQRWFSKMQFCQLRLKAELFDDYYRDTAAIQKNDMIAFLKASTSYRLKDSIKKSNADMHIYFGEKENRIIKRSAALIGESADVSSLIELPGMFHGDFSINHPLDYVNAINNVAGKF
ncbi:MAG: alpha/beta hydrolase [Ruminococcus sp.]|nr:alpha/beta hydrolase [Ruminococcus sp.]